MALDTWQQWDGRVVGGRYELRQYLGGSDHSAAYLTDFGGARALVKLVAADAHDGPTQLARWEAVCNLAHPNLLRVYETGRWHADDEQDMFFAVMEYADETLDETLAERALTPGEVREMLAPTLAALDYLHERNLVYGFLKPSNVMAVGQQLKLAADGVRRSGARLTSLEQEDWRAVPEVFNSGVSSRNDIWALGLLLVESLTGKAPKVGKSADGLDSLPEIAEPFRSIAQACLQRDPAKRCSISEIRKMLERPVEVVKPAVQVIPIQPEGNKQAKLQPPEVLPQPDPAAEQVTPLEAAVPEQVRDPETKPRQRSFELQESKLDSADSASKATIDLKFLLDEKESPKRDYKRFVPFAVALLLVLVVVFVLAHFMGRGSENPTPQTESAAPAVAADSAHVQQTSAPVPNPVARPASGAIAQQVMPEVSRAAQNSIHGVVKVRVEANVDASGEVKQARLNAHGPSRYFAKQALDAARQWKFAPPIVDGSPIASRWMIEFDFRRSGVNVAPRMITSRG